MTTGRNAPCPCGSGKKYKQCCGRNERPAPSSAVDVPALLRQGFHFFQSGQPQQAEMLFQRVLALQPHNPDALNLLGLLSMQTGRAAAAVELLRRAVAVKPKMAAYHNNLGNALRSMGQAEEAMASYAAALRLDPAYARAHNNLGITLKTLERVEDAEKSFRQAVRYDQNLTEAWANLGNTLLDRGFPDEAIPCLERALKLDPNLAEAHSTLGSALRFMPGELERALRHHELALARMPGFVMARWRRAFSLLTAGNLERAWVEYACRFKADEKLARSFPQPWWEGESLAGKSLLIWGEQGVGDEILFAEGIMDARQAGARVIVECEARLVALFTRSFPGVEVYGRENPPHPRLQQADIDYQLPMGSLARWYRPTVESFPAHRGYLKPASERVEHWKAWLASLGPGLKVGISWRSMKRGADRDSYYTELSQWGEVLKMAGVVFVNLQYGDCRAELDEASQRFGVEIHEAPGLNLKDELDDAAALTKALDLAIAPNTSVFGMAGAVGAPTWLLNLDSDWTMLGTDRVPWFPSVKVYRKSWGEPWAPLLAQVAGELGEITQKGKA